MNTFKTFSMFCQETTLHGWGNLQRAGTKLDKIIWMVAIIGSFSLAFYLIPKYNTNAQFLYVKF